LPERLSTKAGLPAKPPGRLSCGRASLTKIFREPKVEPFPVIRLCKIPKDDRPRWLIEGLWSRQGCGIVGGHPRLGKTWVALEMALAIASGRPCMGRFAVRDRGPVLVYCIEDGKHGVRDRMEGLCEARGLDFEKLGIGWIDAEELTLDRPEDQARLHATVEKNRAKAIVLDPLVRLHLARTVRERLRRSARFGRGSWPSAAEIEPVRRA